MTTKRRMFLVLLAVLVAHAQPALSSARRRAVAPPFPPSLVITKGGTYSGSWGSRSPATPAVAVLTSEPVIIENCTVVSAGDGIASYNEKANLTVRHCTGSALNPNIAGRQKGSFVVVSNFASVAVENNSMDGFREAAYCVNYPTDTGTTPSQFSETIKNQTVLFRYNVVRNVDGRFSDGAGGFINGSFSAGTAGPAAAFTTWFVRDARIEIAWNEIVNEPHKSQPEDCINTPESRGLPSSPIAIHDNFVQGVNPADVINVHMFTGCGIQIGDSPSKGNVGYVHVYDNQVVNYQSCGVSISSGHDNEVDHNRSISSRMLPDGTLLNNDWRIPLQMYDNYFIDWTAPDRPVSDAYWFNNSMHDNSFNAVQRDGYAAPSIFHNLTPTVVQSNNFDPLGHLATAADELAEYALWQDKLRRLGLAIGP